MRRACLSVCAVAVAVMAVVGSATASNGAHVLKVPFNVSSQGQAAIAACVGEHVTFTGGEFNIVLHETATVATFHRNVIGGRGTGDLTGTTYIATGHIQATDVLPPSGGETYTYELTLNVVAQGGSAHFTAHALFHVTFLPDGTLTSYVNTFEIRCT